MFKIIEIKLIGENMKISWIKYKDDDSFKLFKNLGMDVYDIDDFDMVDNKLKELVDNNYKTIVLSNQVASFSEDIIKKYKKSEDISIIIAPNKK
ncbi:MAG: hypothetical protein HFJ19_03780 [Clostridia bacterium]|nr:hypothetical protein [Clostridia bacterium]